MDHRHLHWTPYISRNDHDQSNNHMQGYYNTTNGHPLVYSTENSPSTGILRRLPPWNPTRHSSVPMYTPNNNIVTPLFRHDAAGPSHSPFRHPSAAVSFNPVTPLCYPGQASSSSAYGRRIEDDPTVNGRRGSYKRKTHGFSGVVFERGSSSSGNLFQQEAPPPPPNRPFWGSPHVPPNPTIHPEATPIQTGDQASFRNVRSRVFYESNLTRTPSMHHHPGLSNPTPFSHSERSVFHSSGGGNRGSYSSRDQQMWSSRSSLGWRNNNNRSSSSNGRWYRSGSYPRGLQQAVVLLEYHRSGDSVDRHGDMRMDVDHMSYEELVALGERIGNVSTGLTEEMVSNCINETCYEDSCCLEGEEGRWCSICLEEYEKGEMVGKLKKCGHEYHKVCINKWLGFKNSCPVCKAAAY